MSQTSILERDSEVTAGLPSADDRELTRRVALAKLGIAATVVYAAPTVLKLDRSANARTRPSPCSRSRRRSCRPDADWRRRRRSDRGDDGDDD